MASKLTRDEVARIARLAHLELTSSELDTYARQLTDILAYAAIVQEATFESVESSAAPTTVPAALRSDAAAPSIDRAAVLAEAPDAALEPGVFRVPKVL